MASRLQLENVTTNLGGRPIVLDLDLTAAPGELVCLLGPSGCGKSTTLRLISGFLQPDRGRITIGEREVTALSPQRRPTAMVFQNYALWPHMTVFDNVAFGLRVRHAAKSDLERLVGEMLRLVGMAELRDRRPARLSGGEQQRVALARALVLEPEVLLLDEPLSNLDAKLRVQVREEIRDIQQRLEITTVFVTHDQDEALSVADRVAVMSGGRLEQIATPDELYRRPRTRFAAEFIGTMNFASGRRSGRGVEIGPAATEVPCGEVAAVDGPVEIAVRPEETFLRPAGSGGPAAEVLKRTPRGHFTEVTVRFGGVVARAFVAPDFVVPDPPEVTFGKVHFYRDGVLCE